jgi:hypothetical protein
MPPTLVTALLADVGFTPNASGMPGAGLIQQLLNWLGQLALWGSLASILLGAALYGIAQHTGNASGSYRGKQMVIAGAAGACLAGIAAAAVNLLFRAAGS